MKITAINILPFVLLFSCSQKIGSSSDTRKSDSLLNIIDTVILPATDSISNKIEDTETATYFIVIADTSKDYYFLDKEMFLLNEKTKLAIDTAERFYNKKKDLIALPDNHEDDIYAGGYYPRRYPTHDLSLEYLNFYKETAPEKTIALVASICGNMEEGDSIVKLIKPIMPNAYLLKAKVFIGCMH